MSMNNRIIIQLAALFHDPPWKPWVVLRSRHKEAAPGTDSIKSGAQDLLKGYETLYVKLLGLNAPKHEEHAIIVPLAVAAKLKQAGLEEIARPFEKAALTIVGHPDYSNMKEQLKNADHIASAIDRHTLYKELEKVNLQHEVYTETLRFVNPFTLDQLVLPKSIPDKLIVGFLEEYSNKVASALKKLCNKERRADNCGPLAVTVAYLLLEPVWYYVTSLNGGIYVPVADTRVPTHTVFDHANSVMAVLHLLEDGCLAVVDLAGVQAWISEARRLRDLWAASWLASYLAWRAVEPLVREYGPGVLVSPPGRLNPFLASRLLGPWLQGVKEEWVWKALGLSPEKRWPVDPVVPTRLLLAVPSEACKRLEQTVRDALEKAWSEILDTTLGRVREACQGGGDCGAPEELFELAMNIEPPLAVRILTVRYGEYANESRLTLYQKMLAKLADKEDAKISATGRRTGKGYIEYARKSYETSRERLKLCTVCGRGIALVLAKEGIKYEGNNKIHRGLLMELAGDDLCPYCLVKRILRKSLTYPANSEREDPARRLAGLSLEKGKVTWKSVWSHTTRLRLLRYLVESREDIAEMIAGIVQGVDANNEKGDVDIDLSEILIALKTPVIHDIPRSITSSVSRILGDKKSVNPEDIASKLWTIIVEALDSPDKLNSVIKDENISTSARETAERIAEVVSRVSKLVGNAPRRYAIVQADGDYMGSGLLSGKIPRARLGGNSIEPAGPEEYFREGRALAPVDDEGKRDEILSAYTRLAVRIREELDSIKRRCEQKSDDPVKKAKGTLPVTPAYHMSVSRSLALVSALDRDSVERIGGDVVFLGGDDALVIAAPEDWRGGNRWFPALRVAEELRKSWRGLPSIRGNIGLPSGFLALVHEDRILHFAPAPGAYGRSAVVYLGDARYPLWLSLAAARGLEEAKDGSRTLLDGREAWRKDILVVASDTRGAAVLPLSDAVPIGRDNTMHRWEGWWPVVAARRLLHMVHDPPAAASEPAVSSRLLYSPAETVARMVRASLDSRLPERVRASARLVASELSQRTTRAGFVRLVGDERMMPANAVNICGRHSPESMLDPGLCILVTMARAEALPAKPPMTKDEREEMAWRIVAGLFSVEVETMVERLRIGGVDYAANGYMRGMTVRTGGGEVVRLPLPLGVLAAAYVYASAVSPRLS